MAEREKEKRCLRCQRRNSEKHRYCTGCGAPLQNRCTHDGGLLGKPCSKVNPEDAVYCSACGSYTAYYKAGLLSSEYPENRVLEIDEAGEMHHFEDRFFNE